MTLNETIPETLISDYARDGVILVRNVLSEPWLSLIEAGIKRNLNNPGPYAESYFEGQEDSFYSDYCNYANNPEYRILMECSPIADIMRIVLKSKQLWLFYDQIFIKEGKSRRTPWHQDTPYFVADGTQMGSAWITLDPITRDECLEYVIGSHRGPIYNAAVFTDEADKEWYKGSEMQPLPDIDAERDKWDIAAWDVEPGDLLILHPSILHGGGETKEGGRRRTMSIRFFGDDATYVERPGRPAPPFHGISESLKPGDLLRHPYFPLIR